MTRKEYERAQKLMDEITSKVAELDPAPDVLRDIARLKRMLSPPPTMEEILLKVPGGTHTARAREIGISRAGYYNLLAGTARRDLRTAKRLAELTGLSESVIKEVW